MSHPFRGPAFSIGNKVRVKKESWFLFTHQQSTNGVLTVRSTRIEDIEDCPDGMPYTDEYSHQLITINEFVDSTKEASASHFELVN